MCYYVLFVNKTKLQFHESKPVGSELMTHMKNNGSGHTCRNTSTCTWLTSICLTVRSRNVASFLTEMRLLGPTQPMLVPRPPFSFSTTSLSSNARADSLEMAGAGLMDAYDLTCGEGEEGKEGEEGGKEGGKEGRGRKEGREGRRGGREGRGRKEGREGGKEGRGRKEGREGGKEGRGRKEGREGGKEGRGRKEGREGGKEGRGRKEGREGSKERGKEGERRRR